MAKAVTLSQTNREWLKEWGFVEEQTSDSLKVWKYYTNKKDSHTYETLNKVTPVVILLLEKIEKDAKGQPYFKALIDGAYLDAKIDLK